MKIALALSGGGALGAAHIGVIEQIEKAGIKIDLISGVSAGSIIGAIYSAQGIKAVNEFVEEMGSSFAKKIISAPTPQKFFDQMTGIIGKYVPNDFAKLRLPFYPAATDIQTGERVVFSSGNPLLATMASAAYPGVFPIQNIDNHFYTDGGVTGNLPADVAKHMGADFIIGSNIYMLNTISAEEVKKLNAIKIALRTTDILQFESSKTQMRLCKFNFMPNVSTHRWYQFNAMNEIRETGRENAKKQIHELSDTLWKTLYH